MRMAKADSIQMAMIKRRAKFIQGATSTKELSFGYDPDVLNFIIEDFRFAQWNDRGNGLTLREWPDYRSYYYVFTHKSDYEEMVDRFKELYLADGRRNKMLKYLMDTAKMLRARYGRH